MYWVGKLDNASPTEQITLIRQFHVTGDCSLRDKVIKSNYGLVLNVASHYEKAYALNSDDLFQEGVLGLLKAFERFDPERGIKFHTYATYWANLFILQYVKHNSKIVTLTEYANAQLSKVSKGNTEGLKKKLGEFKYNQIANLAHPDSDKHPIGGLRDKENFIDEIKNKNCKQIINDIIKTFNVKEKVILRCRYGLNKGKKKKLEEISIPFNVTKECIRQIERRAIRKLKRKLENLGMFSIGDIHDKA